MLIPLFSDPVDLPESEKLTLSLCCCKDRPSVWKAIYFECLTSGKHFLEQVLVSWAFNVWLLGCSLIVFNHVGRKLSNAIVHVCSWQVTALDLIKHEELDQLRDLLKLEFRPLSRLLLLLGWNHCRSLSSAKMLLSILHLDQVRRPPPPAAVAVASADQFFYFSRHQRTTLSFRSLPISSPLSWDSWNGVNTTTRELAFWVFQSLYYCC